MSGPLLPAGMPPTPQEFTLMRGGPVFRLWCRFGLADAEQGLWHRRVAAITLVAWLPLLLLSLGEGTAFGGTALPFLRDIETHVRLLVALPLLLAAEVVTHRRMLGVTAQFLERGLIPDGARARFDAAVASAYRVRDSSAAEVALLALVYGIGVLYIWRYVVAPDVDSWYRASTGGSFQPSLAGWWQGLVSVPLFQFLLLRWYYRLFIWVRFLWQVSRIELHLVPTHPDRCGGLGFLGLVGQALAPLVLAQSALLSGVTANRILSTGAHLLQFKVELIVWAALMVALVLGPQIGRAHV